MFPGFFFEGMTVCWCFIVGVIFPKKKTEKNHTELHVFHKLYLALVWGIKKTKKNKNEWSEHRKLPVKLTERERAEAREIFKTFNFFTSHFNACKHMGEQIYCVEGIFPECMLNK